MKNLSFVAMLWLFFGLRAASAGTFGTESFSNDAALDWVANELKPGGQKAIERAIRVVTKTTEYLEAPEACKAIAACEVLAAAQGRAGSNLPKDVLELAKKLTSNQGDALRKEAVAAIERILKDSELKGLWSETPKYEEWRKSVLQLKARI